jgi:hypothetical protein
MFCQIASGVVLAMRTGALPFATRQDSRRGLTG